MTSTQYLVADAYSIGCIVCMVLVILAAAAIVIAGTNKDFVEVSLLTFICLILCLAWPVIAAILMIGLIIYSVAFCFKRFVSKPAGAGVMASQG